MINFSKLQNRDYVSILDNTVSLRVGKGGSGYSAGIRISNSLLSLIVNSILKTVYFLLSPMPWSWRHINDVLVFATSLVMDFCLVKSFIMKKRHFSNITLALLISFFAFCIPFSLGVSNAGTALRHRTKLFFMFPLAISLLPTTKIRDLQYL